MKKMSLNPLQLDKETIALLDANQLNDVIGGMNNAAVAGCSSSCGSGGSTCSAGGSTGCGSGSSVCKPVSACCGSGSSVC